MTVREFALPDLGEGLTEADLVTWEVAVGDTVTLNQVIAEVETAKALVQLPSPYAGVVTALLVEPGTTVEVGSPIIAVDVAAEGAAGGGAAPEGAAGGGPAAAQEAKEAADVVSGAAAEGAAADAAPGRTSVLVGYGPPVEGGAHPRRRARSASWAARHDVAVATAPTAAPTPPAASAAEARAPSSGDGVRTHARSRSAERPRSYPPVRRLAHDLGIDLADVPGTGDEGLITRDDVLAYAARTGVDGSRNGHAAGVPAAAPASSAPAGEPARLGHALGEQREVRIPVTGVRKHTAAAMVASAFTAPHATEFLTVDVTPSMELLADLASDRRFAGHRVTVLALVAKAMTVALRRSPTLNAHWDDATGEIVQYGYVDLGIAAATPRGLLVPVVRDAERLDLVGLADAIGTLAQAARAGTTPPADLAGGTISVTNIGVFGIDSGTPILVPGQAAILGTGAVRRLPWEYRDEVALRSVMTLSLSFDHRVVDGEQASRFLADVGEILARPGMVVTMV